MAEDEAGGGGGRLGPSRASRRGPSGTSISMGSSMAFSDLRRGPAGIFKGPGPRHSQQGILPRCRSLGCLWNRPRIEPFVDVALGPARAMRAVARHLTGARPAGRGWRSLTALRSLVLEWRPEPPAARLVRVLAGRPVTHRRRAGAAGPRILVAAVLEAGLGTSAGSRWQPRPRASRSVLVLWPADAGAVCPLAAPVMVQDVSSADPDRSVMVYSSPRMTT